MTTDAIAHDETMSSEAVALKFNSFAQLRKIEKVTPTFRCYSAAEIGDLRVEIDQLRLVLIQAESLALAEGR
jgi:hypothetical protein